MPTLQSPEGPINYKERPGSPKESYRAQVYTVQREFDVAWGDRWSFVHGLLGDASVVTVVGNTYAAYVQRNVPQGYASPLQGAGNSPLWMYPTSVDSIEPIGADAGLDANGVAQYGQTAPDGQPYGARVTVTYEGTHYKVLSDADMKNAAKPGPFVDDGGNPAEYTLARFVTAFAQPTAEYLSLPLGTMRWVEINDSYNDKANNNGVYADKNTKPAGLPVGGAYPGSPVTNAQGRIIASTEVNLTWHMTPVVPSAISSAIGTLNSKSLVDPYGRVPPAAPRTLLLTNVEIKPYRWIGGKYLFDVSYKFRYFSPPPDRGQGNPLQLDQTYFLHYRPLENGANLPPVWRQLTHNGAPPSAPGANFDPSAGVPLYRDSDFNLLFVPT